MSDSHKTTIIDFIRKNSEFIHVCKFFWWEPLLEFSKMKEICTETENYFRWTREIVTNTSLLNEEICAFLGKYFQNIFFSIDSENPFSYEKVKALTDGADITGRVCFNIVVSPWKEINFYTQFEKLLSLGYRNFNILPVYFTKEWTKETLKSFSDVLRKVIDECNRWNIQLYGFQKNNGYNYALTYPSIFLDLDGKSYFSDFVSASFWKGSKNNLFLWDIKNLDLSEKLPIASKIELLKKYETDIIQKVRWQKELHEIMDYFSHYLNVKKDEL